MPPPPHGTTTRPFQSKRPTPDVLADAVACVISELHLEFTMSRHTPRDQRLALVAAWCESDDSMSLFARKHRINIRTFRSWVRARRGPEIHADFLEVQLPPLVVSPPRPSFGVRIAGVDITFNEPPPAPWFAAVLRDVGRC